MEAYISTPRYDERSLVVPLRKGWTLIVTDVTDTGALGTVWTDNPDDWPIDAKVTLIDCDDTGGAGIELAVIRLDAPGCPEHDELVHVDAETWDRFAGHRD